MRANSAMAIRQFDIFPNPVRRGREHKPFVMSLQHRNLDHLHTRVVAPLIVEIRATLSALNPIFVIDGQRVFLDPADLGTMEVRLLRKPVANLESERYRIRGALDLLLTGI
jgi:toxin CcdB